MIRRSFRFGLWMGVLAALVYAATRSRQRELPSGAPGTTAEPWPPVQPATDRFPSASPAEAPAPATTAPPGVADSPMADEATPADDAVARADELSTEEAEADEPAPVDDPTDLTIDETDARSGDRDDAGSESVEWAASDLPMSRPVRKARPPRKRKAPARRRLRAKRRAALEEAAEPEPHPAGDEVADGPSAAEPEVETGAEPEADAQPSPAPRKRKAAAKKKPAAPSTAWVEPSDGACPDSHPVKANMDSKIFHVPGGLSYERTNAHRCYQSPDAATEDGLRQAKR